MGTWQSEGRRGQRTAGLVYRSNNMYGLVLRESGEINKGIYVRRQGLENKSTEKELTVLGKSLPVLRYKDPKCCTVWYNLCGWVSKK